MTLLLLVLVLAGAGPAAATAPIDSISGIAIPTAGPFVQTQNGKLQTGVASPCNTPKAAPAVNPGSFDGIALGEQSLINEPTCITVQYSTADASCLANGLFSAAYLGSFDPGQIQTNYLGDVGQPPINSNPVSYSVMLPPHKQLIANWNMSSAGAGCASFDLQISSDHPFALASPPINGHPFVGETLTAVDTLWSGSPSFTHQWRRCAADGTACADIAGAAETTYTPTAEDVGHALSVHVSATEGGLTSTADSDPLLIGIQFDAADGQALGASDATQSGRLARVLKPSSCFSTPKAAPSTADVAHTRFYDVYNRTNASDGTICAMVSLSVPQTCSAAGLFSAAYLPAFDPATSLQKNYLADTGISLIGTRVPFRDSFVVPAGAAYDVVVTTNTAAASCASYDLRLGTTAPYPTGAPSVEGTPVAGQTLTASDGSWIGTPAFGYQWQRCFGDGSGCADRPGATGKTLALTAKDVGDAYRVRVTATEGAGSASKLSGASGAVTEAPPGPPPPGWRGIALRPQTKTVGSKGSITLALACPASAMVGCAGTDAIKLGKATVGSNPFAIAPGRTARLKFTLSKALRKKLVRRKKLVGSQVVRSFDLRGLALTTRAKLTLKRARR